MRHNHSWQLQTRKVSFSQFDRNEPHSRAVKLCVCVCVCRSMLPSPQCFVPIRTWRGDDIIDSYMLLFFVLFHAALRVLHGWHNKRTRKGGGRRKKRDYYRCCYCYHNITCCCLKWKLHSNNVTFFCLYIHRAAMEDQILCTLSCFIYVTLRGFVLFL